MEEKPKIEQQQLVEAENFDIEIDEGVKEVKGLTTKEIKALARPEFQKNPEKFYPTKIFEKYGFHRTFCPKCKNPYWRRTEKSDTCGDSNCVGKYTFIGKGTGIGRKGQKINYVDAWKSFEKSLTHAAIPCTPIDRYPVIARWRNDVDYTAAGIYCFQPYCVTGELDPPANPLICPQFCVRFNDLDNIGLTGRHYSGFVMIGMQVFNKKDKHVFWKEECVEFNYLWLVQELGVDPDEITFIEDVWAGGGNLGPSVEYFVGGLEVGNMVFMQFKTFPDGSRQELDIKVIDVGIGMERIPWLINGTPTSYNDTYKVALQYLVEKLNVNLNTEIWEKIGPLTCQLDVDEAQDIEETWRGIAKLINMDVSEVKKAIAPVRDLYIVLDHTRTIFMIISDGGLPSNVGGGCNARNILRRVFAIIKKNGWFEILKMEGFLKLFEMHKKDLEVLYGKFPEYKSFESIIQIEYDRWVNTDNEQKIKLEKYIKKHPKLTIDDWVVAVTSWGISADAVAQISQQEIPDNLYYIIAQRQELIHKVAPTALYNTNYLQETIAIFYDQQKDNKFTAKLIEIFANVQDKNKRDIVVLNQSLFYPTAGGQQNDIGFLTIDNETYKVINCVKAGKVVFHYLDRPLPIEDNKHYIGQEIQGEIDKERRQILTRHHTATHVMFSACRKVLGPHIWQHGAKKTVEQAHLDVTHYKSLTFEQELEIENEANKIIMGGHPIKKFFIDKAQAEKNYGFRLYQGGIVPGNELRVVLIDDTDVEACCGTHCSNTNEIGWIKLLKTQRIQDGIVRLYYVAGTKSIEKLNLETKVIAEICNKWSIPKHQIIETAERFFKGYKKYSQEALEKTELILKLQMKYLIDSQNKYCLIKSDQSSPTLYFSGIPKYAQEIKEKQKGIIFIGNNFIYGLIHDANIINVNELKDIIAKDNAKMNDFKVNNQVSFQNKTSKKKEKVEKIIQFNFVGIVQIEKVIEYFQKNAFQEIIF